MNPYAMLGSGSGINDAASLGARLTAWHDAMVAHERRLRTGRSGEICGDECPHAEARALWFEAVETFGSRADTLAFLRSRAQGGARKSGGDTRGHHATAAPAGQTAAAAEL
jgi:hypothetical protein